MCGQQLTPLSQAAFYLPLEELEKLAPLTGQLFKSPSLVQGDVILAYGST